MGGSKPESSVSIEKCTKLNPFKSTGRNMWVPRRDVVDDDDDSSVTHSLRAMVILTPSPVIFNIVWYLCVTHPRELSN